MASKLETLLQTLWVKMPEAARDAFDIDSLSSWVHSMWVLCFPNEEVPTKETLYRKLSPFMKRMSILKDLRGRTYAPQRSTEWLNLRKELLTASNLADALNKGKFSSRVNLVSKKAEERCQRKPQTSETSGGAAAAPTNGGFFKCFPMKWGTMFEPMIARIYSEMNNDIDLYEFGLVIHPTLKCFGASPDGITSMGKMLEIKCPWKRVIVKGEVPDHYYLQIQGQLAVCGLDECDYLEVVMEDLENVSVYFQTIPETERHAHGILLELQGGNEGAADEDRYLYSPAKLTPKEAYEWVRATIRDLSIRDPNVNVSKMRFWKMKDMNLVSVPFDPDLWASLVPEIQRFWDDVVCKTKALEALTDAPPIPPGGAPMEIGMDTGNADGAGGASVASVAAGTPAKKKPRAKREKKIETFTYREDEDQCS
jgi:putative phage-type endonuclease